jgi:hypothetical protein
MVIMQNIYFTIAAQSLYGAFSGYVNIGEFMKTLTLFAFILLALISTLPTPAHAESQIGDCELSFNIHIRSLLIFSKGGGTGVVTCWSGENKVAATSNVTIEIEGLGLGLGAFQLQGIAGSIGVMDPRELVGTYAVAQASVGFGGAVGASLGFHGQKNGLSFTGNVNAGRGVGVFLNGTSWTITLAR